MINIKSVPCYHGWRRPQIMDTKNGLETWWVAANVSR